MAASKSQRGRRPKTNDFVERAIYAGTKFLGAYRPENGGLAAFDATGKRLGLFSDASGAREAILAALGAG